jgi:hypothetical protein
VLTPVTLVGDVCLDVVAGFFWLQFKLMGGTTMG